MKRLFVLICLAIGLAGPTLADPGAVRTVIRDQIHAFKSDDFERAFTYASPTIRGIFQTPERFGQMVRQGYPMVWRPVTLRFLPIEEHAEGLVQPVMIRDAQGALHILDYDMVEGETGWKIDGVQLRAPAGAV
ncbi:DUF4864 domain-containing protein [Roseovarius sp. A21]|uniref:DUF4864 domain-containing protein n=1 Tax=Roseovarius bejariae TaxID=2576383 RepID=A0A844CL96_9RHOB|nr:DUF4864 domain-containing protein [Roseovarius bejariae]MRU14245.1 DUF4864 domain-containing protein [Roseovarius bejariae]